MTKPDSTRYLCDCGDGIQRDETEAVAHAEQPEWYDTSTGRFYRHDQSEVRHVRREEETQ